MAELNLCEPWLSQAWGALKAPLGLRDGLPAPADQDAESIQALVQALCQGDDAAAQRVCQRWRAQFGEGRTQPSHTLALVLWVVEQIERDWQADRRSYGDTLYAFWNVQRLLQTWDSPLGVLQRPSAPSGHAGRLLLASAPHCQHHLGVLVVAEHFRNHGWQVQTLLDANPERLLQASQQTGADVVGLSVGHDGGLQGLADLISALRATRESPGPRILLGGQVFIESPSHFEWLGADGIASSVDHALALCGQWVQRQHH